MNQLLNVASKEIEIEKQVFENVEDFVINRTRENRDNDKIVVDILVKLQIEQDYCDLRLNRKSICRICNLPLDPECVVQNGFYCSTHKDLIYGLINKKVMANVR